jgi:hypothetical protein
MPGKSVVTPRERLFRGMLAALCLGLLVAFWMLCSHQVRKAQMRDISLQVQRVAVADCLQYIPRATLNSCVDRVDPGRRDAKAVLAAGEKAATPANATGAKMSSAGAVSFTYR